MAGERTFTEAEYDACYQAGLRTGEHLAQRQEKQSGGKVTAAIFLVGFIIVVGVMIWTAYRQEQERGAIPQPTAPPATARVAPVALPAAPPAPVIVQSVPQGQAPQLVAPQPVLHTAPLDSSAPVVAPAPKPIVIVVHEGGGAPRITGSGACDVAAKGARRCGK